MDALLQSYADRGVFRGFSAQAGPRGARVYRFTWLTRAPLTLVLAPVARTFTFVGIFPQPSSVRGLPVALRRAIARHATREVPPHRRLEARRATMTARVARGDLSLRVTVHAGDPATVARLALSVVNDLFQFLHECYPDYLSMHFGTPDE